MTLYSTLGFEENIFWTIVAESTKERYLLIKTAPAVVYKYCAYSSHFQPVLKTNNQAEQNNDFTLMFEAQMGRPKRARIPFPPLEGLEPPLIPLTLTENYPYCLQLDFDAILHDNVHWLVSQSNESMHISHWKPFHLNSNFDA